MSFLALIISFAQGFGQMQLMCQDKSLTKHTRSSSMVFFPATLAWEIHPVTKLE